MVNKLNLFRLKLTKNPAIVLHILERVCGSIFGSAFSNIIPNSHIIEIEKLLLLSASAIDFAPSEDMRNPFLRRYIDTFCNELLDRFGTEEIIYLFESSGSGISFQYCQGDKRNSDTRKELAMYILSRLILYRLFLIEYFSDKNNNLESFAFAVANYYFYPGRFELVNERTFITDVTANTGETCNIDLLCFSEILDKLKPYYNIINLPKDVTSRYPLLHTEGKLAYIIPSANNISFSSTNGTGCLVCNDCGYTEQSVISFIHGAMEAMIGRQCPQCGCLCAEFNESKVYHQFGKATIDFKCPKCSSIIRKIDENIFKGNENPIFCPKCESTNVNFKTDYMS